MTGELIDGASPQGLTTEELAGELRERLKLAKPPTTQTIRNWAKAGMRPLTPGKPGVSARFDPDACERWVRENRSGLGRGGERERAGRPSDRKKGRKSRWRDEPSPLLEGAEKRQRANERIAELAQASSAEALADPEVIALERQACKLAHADLVLLAHLTPEVSGLSGAAIQRLEKLETIQSRQVEREKAMGRLLVAGDVRATYERLFGELRQAIDASAGDTAAAIAAMLELDGEGHKKVEKLLKERGEALVASLREVGAAEAAA